MGNVLGSRKHQTYPAGTPPTFGMPNEIVRYAFSITTEMAGTTQTPTANLIGGIPQDSAAPPNFAALLFAAPGGRLDLGDLVVINGGGNTGDPIDFQYVLATITAPTPVPDGSLKVGVIDPAATAGVYGSQIDFSDVLIPANGGIISLRAVIPENVVISTALVVSLSVGIIWNPATIRNPPA